MKPSAHLHLIVTADIKNPPTSDQVDFVSQFMTEMVEHVRMKIMISPQTDWCADEGNEGITSIVVLTTSHSVIHIWNNPEPELSKLEFDLYSCAPFTPQEVIEKIKSAFQVENISYKFLDRTDGLIDIDA